MDHCCDDKASELTKLHERQGSVLKWALAINLTMFVIEAVSGLRSHSNALLADSLDMLGDALVYAFSLYVLHKGELWRIRASLLKGIGMGVFGVGILVNAIFKIYSGPLPIAETISVIGGLALIANGVTFWILYSHKSDDLNMHSTWLCTRNDIVANIGVIIAGFLVGMTQSIWPDTLVAGIISLIVLNSAAKTVMESRRELKKLKT